jgi:alpha-amylase
MLTVIGWTRLGNSEHPKAMAVIMTDAGAGSKWMNVSRTNTSFVDVTGNRSDTVVSNGDGWANFPVNGGSHSVWVEQSQTQSSNISVTFSCHNGSTDWGQDVYAVGSDAAVGNWNTDSAIKLTPSNYPTWTSTISLPKSSTVEWKCIKKQGSSVQWQSGGNNSVTTPSSGTASTSGSF